MFVQTVNGKVAPESLGITLSHEHLVIDFRCAWMEPPKEYIHLSETEVSSGLISDLRLNPQYSKSNLVLDDEQTSIDELKRFRELGGTTIVDMTNWGLGPDPLKLRRISMHSNVQVVAGCGYYRYIGQNPATLAMKSDELAEDIIKSLLEGIGHTDVRAGIIGEVGTSVPLHPFEYESLIAAAKAQTKTGAAISIHPDVWGRGHLEVLDIIEKARVDPNRVMMSHMDEVVETSWHCEVAKRGVYLSFDTFGSEFSYDGIEEPNDIDRSNCLVELLDKGYVDQLLLSQDLCYKIELTKYGGYGYAHVLSNIVPHLRAHGVSEVELSKMLVENPARLLTITT